MIVTKLGSYSFHPASELFPMMTDKELGELAADIKTNGLLQPIIIHDGKILDGRNRFAACLKVCVPPKFSDWTGTGSPTSWVLSVNLHRRHLKPSQLGVIARKAEPMFAAEAKERQILSGGDRKSDNTKSVEARLPQPKREPQARDLAAATVGVSARYISDVKAIEKAAPELISKIESGDLTIPAAKKQIAQRETIWDAGSIAERPANHEPEDDESDGLWHLKKCWRKASKKEKAAFLKWIEESGSKSKRK